MPSGANRVPNKNSTHQDFLDADPTCAVDLVLWLPVIARRLFISIASLPRIIPFKLRMAKAGMIELMSVPEIMNPSAKRANCGRDLLWTQAPPISMPATDNQAPLKLPIPT